MPTFEYTALDARGKKKNGMVDGESLASAETLLRQKRLYPISLERMEAKAPGSAGIRAYFVRLFTRIRPTEVATITRLLATLLSAGFPLIRALGAVGRQAQSQGLNRLLSRLKDGVEEGSSFAQTLALYPRVFSSVYVNMVAAGESSGTLEIVLERLADFAEKREETRKKISAALAYPAMMCLIGFVVLIILMTHIVPGIVGIFADMNQELPLPTQILIQLSDIFAVWWWAILMLPFAGMGLVWAIRSNEKGREMTDRLLLALPVAGPLIRKLSAARFSRTLGSLLGNGVPMLTALEITRNVAGNQIISQVIQDAAQAVEKGKALGATLEKSRHMPALVVQMIQVGEESGTLETMLEKAADLYEKEVHNAVGAATALIEPLIILFMGVVVGTIIMAVCLPIVEINQFVG